MPVQTWWYCVTPVKVEGRDMATVGEFVVEAGEKVPFVLTYGPSHLKRPPPTMLWRPCGRPRLSGPNGPPDVPIKESGGTRSCAR